MGESFLLQLKNCMGIKEQEGLKQKLTTENLTDKEGIKQNLGIFFIISQGASKVFDCQSLAGYRCGFESCQGQKSFI